MLSEISNVQFERWMAFYYLRPFGDTWRQAGTIAAASQVPYLKEDGHVDPENFMPTRPNHDAEQAALWASVRSCPSSFDDAEE